MMGTSCNSIRDSIPLKAVHLLSSLCPVKASFLVVCQDPVQQQSERKRAKGHQQPHQPATTVRRLQNPFFKNFLFFP